MVLPLVINDSGFVNESGNDVVGLSKQCKEECSCCLGMSCHTNGPVLLGRYIESVGANCNTK